jgi:protein gp37
MMARRQDVPGGAYEGLTTIRNGRVDWLGSARPAPEMLGLPLRWRSPRCVFVESMGDLWHPGIPFEYIAAVFGVMAATRQHVHIILTKQPRRMHQFFEWLREQATARDMGDDLAHVCQQEAWRVLQSLESQHLYPLHKIKGTFLRYPWPLQNVWLLVSAWDQPSAEKYVPHLLACPAVVRGISAEPLLGPMDIRRWFRPRLPGDPQEWQRAVQTPEGPRDGIDWVIVGGESGPHARPMREAWAHGLRDQCNDAGVAFHFKQWGNHAPNADGDLVRLRSKKKGGRVLSGRTWDEFPQGR